MNSEPQVEIFGKFKEPLPNTQESLTICFSPNSDSHKKRWRNNGLSADFLGEYFAAFFPTNDDQDRKIEKSEAVKGTVSFIANELLENAMKYSDGNVNSPVSISLYLYDRALVFMATNYARLKEAGKYKEFIQEVMTVDTQELYSQQIEKTALGEGNSGLGLLTMINDYEANLGWKFATWLDRPEVIQVTIMVQLEV